MESNSSAVKADLFAILDAAPVGYGTLRLAIMEGRIDPVFPKVTRHVRQGCLKAHLAEGIGCDAQELPGAAQLVLRRVGEEYLESAAESFIAKVRFGNKPANCAELRTLIEYMDEWQGQRRVRHCVEVSDEEFGG